MVIELDCPRCRCQFESLPQVSADEAGMARVEEDLWFALGDGETVEDRIYAALASQGAIYCPDCGAQVAVSEDSLGRAAMAMLSSW